MRRAAAALTLALAASAFAGNGDARAADDPLADLVRRYATASPEEEAGIQQAAWSLFETDDATRRRLYAAEKLLLDKYVHEQSGIYAGDGAVEFVYVDLYAKQIAVMFDPSPARDPANGGAIRRNILRDMKRLVGDVPLRAEDGTIRTLSCSSRTSACVPPLGGISIAQAGQAETDASSIGYQAADADGNAGFVIAGHAAGGSGISIVQPGGNGPVLGVVTRYCSERKLCDFAFVRAAGAVPPDGGIYKDGADYYAVRRRVPKTEQRVGTIVMKSGLATGITYGAVYANSPNDPRMLIKDMESGHGDSGSPVFAAATDRDADLYGMMFANSGGTIVFYYAWDTIRDTLGLSN